MIASDKMQKYFASLKEEVSRLYAVAQKARESGVDPELKVEVSLAENMAERVVGLISVVAPQIVGSGVVERIMELEKLYGSLDWRVALKISEELAQEKFCKFKDRKEAIEVGIRTGFAYVTVGVVSSPLDGIVNIDFKKRVDGGGEYLCLNFAGPIRNAGGTAAAVCVIIADYVRKAMGVAAYDCQPDEVRRAVTELRDYHERVTNLQYVPSEEELDFLMKNLCVEVSGDASEVIEVSNYKNLPRISTNNIRSGYCLVLSSCIPLKAAKLWKQLSIWGKEFNLEQWNFLEEFLIIQKKAKSAGAKSQSADKLTPDFTYIKDLVAGRPVLGYPLRSGGFRLRYGRSRVSGFSAQSIHPATMYVLNQYVATGTQLKTERPGKAASMTSCDTIEGPVVRLNDGSVLRLDSLDDAKKVQSQVKEIIYLGDVLISYGDFFNRAHSLIPVGYCEEWWVQEVKKAIDGGAKIEGVSKERLDVVLKNYLSEKPSAEEAIVIAKESNTPLHPSFTLFWSQVSVADLKRLVEWFDSGKVFTGESGVEKIVLPVGDAKRVLEVLGCPHLCVNQEFVVIENDFAAVLVSLFDLMEKKSSDVLGKIVGDKTLDAVNAICSVKQRDKAGTFVGTRMGRPEKAKQREIQGSPHVLFPIGEEGGRLRSFQSALEVGKVTAQFASFVCKKCNAQTVFTVCEVCGERTEHVPFEGRMSDRSVPIKHYFDNVLKRMGISHYPELIKGVRGTINPDHYVEHLGKGILRARYDVHVYKDGTTRYDMTQLPITHFKPVEVGTSIERLIELGYDVDVNGIPLTSDTQILELKPQDIILPQCEESPDVGSGDVLLNCAKFVDDELDLLYKQPRLMNTKVLKDLAGHLTIVLAPHTSAGIVGRIVGFSKTQGLLAHPLLHAATRRDCDGDEACVILMMDALLNFSKKFLPESRGSTMDTPLVLTSVLTPSEVDDMAFDVDIEWQYPLALYDAAIEFKKPWDVKLKQIKGCLGKPEQYEGMGFTHDCGNINETVRCSAYKTLPSMEEKLKGQMDLAEKCRSVEESDVARLVIEKHFLKDTKGNLRKFSMQEFRCVTCNEKFRRPPLIGKCTSCSGRVIFTISEGSVVKYLEPTESLAKKYNVPDYLKETIELLRNRIEGVFGKEAEKQTGLGAWFG
jgi:DNA polymerase II large subunit